jgi:hypothetical protein
MNRPSSTAVAGLGWGWLAAIIMGLIAVFFPDAYERVPAGFEAGLAVGIGFVFAKLKKETVLRERWEAEKLYDQVA